MSYLKREDGFEKKYRFFLSTNKNFKRYECDMKQSYSLLWDELNIKFQQLKQANIITEEFSIKNIIYSFLYRDMILLGKSENEAKNYINNLINHEKEFILYYYLFFTKELKMNSYFILFNNGSIDIIANNEFGLHKKHLDSNKFILIPFNQYIDILFKIQSNFIDFNFMIKRQLFAAYFLANELKLKDYCIKKGEDIIILKGNRQTTNKAEGKKWKKSKYFKFGKFTEVIQNKDIIAIEQEFNFHISLNGDIYKNIPRNLIYGKINDDEKIIRTENKNTKKTEKRTYKLNKQTGEIEIYNIEEIE